MEEGATCDIERLAPLNLTVIDDCPSNRLSPSFFFLLDLGGCFGAILLALVYLEQRENPIHREVSRSLHRRVSHEGPRILRGEVKPRD